VDDVADGGARWMHRISTATGSYVGDTLSGCTPGAHEFVASNNSMIATPVQKNGSLIFSIQPPHYET